MIIKMKITWSEVRERKLNMNQMAFIEELSNATLQYITCHGNWTIIFRILDMDTILVIIDMIGCEWWKKKKKSYTSNYLLLLVSHDKIWT